MSLSILGDPPLSRTSAPSLYCNLLNLSTVLVVIVCRIRKGLGSKQVAMGTGTTAMRGAQFEALWEFFFQSSTAASRMRFRGLDTI